MKPIRNLTLALLVLLAACSTSPEPESLLGTRNTSTTLRIPLAKASDDAEELARGSVSVDGGLLDFNAKDGAAQTVGVRFQKVAVPRGAKITRVHLEVTGGRDDAKPVRLQVSGEAAANAANFTTSRFDLSSRKKTAATSLWRPNPWRKGGPYKTGDLSAIVQEVVNGKNWKSGNALAFFIDGIGGTGKRSAVTYETNAKHRPVLVVTFDTGEAAPEPTPEPAPAPTPERELIFADEFGGTALDTSKWSSGYPWTNPDGNYNRSTGEQQVYLPRNIVVSDGTVKLIAKRESVNGRPYTSGMISSDPRNGAGFLHTYGYIEARIKVPGGKGMWPAFWNLPWPVKWPPEIDIVEVLGDECIAEFHLHPEANYQGTNVCDTWHTYAVDWRPGKVVWYLDGVERYREEGDHAPSQPMYLLLNLAVGGTWPGSPDISTPFPGVMEIDYVRVYR